MVEGFLPKSTFAPFLGRLNFLGSRTQGGDAAGALQSNSSEFYHMHPKHLKLYKVATKKLFSTKISKFFIWPLFDPCYRYGNEVKSWDFWILSHFQTSNWGISPFWWSNIILHPKSTHFLQFRAMKKIAPFHPKIPFFGAQNPQNSKNCDFEPIPSSRKFCGHQSTAPVKTLKVTTNMLLLGPKEISEVYFLFLEQKRLKNGQKCQKMPFLTKKVKNL